jgi:enamine deaminase RidA (YjgF/YER057c/UK114 family)
MQPRNPPDVHPPVAAYAHQIEVAAPARWLVLSGQIGQRPDGTLPAEPLAQLQVALDNVAKNLAAAGITKAHLVKLTFYLVGDIAAAERRRLVEVWLGAHRPCSTLVYVAGLATPDLRVEIDAWASAETPAP